MFEAFLENKNNWISGKGPFSDIVFSSRVRLARNLSNYPFPAKMSLSEKKELLQTVKKVFDRSELLRKSSFVFMGETSDVDRRFLLERHLISQEHIADPQGKALIVSDDERVSIMVNEEDHLRIQAISSGFSFDDCWPILNAIDDELNSELGFSFSSNFGYLTSCPTNVGTALRVS
ncbi:MAG: ATP--guanido phosphotransferase, partial [Candidatus Omnitrophica bacterium]|nr:ATP--guanido phosphotransferase [Candidatus Omnitrophota bacterium]